MLRQAFSIQWVTRGRALACSLFSYSSYVHIEPDAGEIRGQLLDAALKHVQQQGFTTASLTAAAKDLQLSPSAAGMFSRGASELVEHVIKQHNQQLADDLQTNQQEFLKLPIRQRIAVAVRKRLEMNAKYMDSWPQALAVLAQPRNSPAAAKLLFQLLDDIWYAAGDTSTDVNWYTKRALLAAVYTSTELYMLTDFSPGYQDTWEQLDRRIADVLWLGGAAKNAAAVPQQLITAALQAFSGSSYASMFGSSSRAGGSSSTAAAGWSDTPAAAAAAEAVVDVVAAQQQGQLSGSQLQLVITATGMVATSSSSGSSSKSSNM